jgi:hypothetical protein
MKKIIACLLLFVGAAQADVVSISTSTPTQIISARTFTSKSIALYAAANGVYLNSQPIVSTQTFVNSGYVVGTSSQPLVIPNFQGALYGEAPNSGSAVTVNYIGGQ